MRRYAAKRRKNEKEKTREKARKTAQNKAKDGKTLHGKNTLYMPRQHLPQSLKTPEIPALSAFLFLVLPQKIPQMTETFCQDMRDYAEALRI